MSRGLEDQVLPNWNSLTFCPMASIITSNSKDFTQSTLDILGPQPVDKVTGEMVVLPRQQCLTGTGLQVLVYTLTTQQPKEGAGTFQLVP